MTLLNITYKRAIEKRNMSSLVEYKHHDKNLSKFMLWNWNSFDIEVGAM